MQNQQKPDRLFDYVDEHTREMLLNAYKAITLTEMWTFMKQDIFSYMWGNNIEIKFISAKMSELGYNCHSGSSFGWTMREMQFIAQYGLEAHRNKYCKSKPESEPEPEPEPDKSSQLDTTTQIEQTLPDSTLLVLEPIIIPSDELLLALPCVPRESVNTVQPPKSLSPEELQQIKDEISEKTNYTTAQEGLRSVVLDPQDITDRIQGAFTEFKEKTGRNMTYLEMRSIMG